MATYSHHTTLFFLIITLTFFRSSEAAGIAICWGQNANEGSLADACNTGKYQYVNIAYLTNFGSADVTPDLNLAGHCDPNIGGCTYISNDIKTCQSRGIKVLLSIGGDSNGYSLVTDFDAKDLADYLWGNFLGGGSDSRPLGDAVLDGIDFDIQTTSFGDHWDDLARDLAQYRFYRKIYLSVSPRCLFPDSELDAAIQTGLFDFIWPKFYNDTSCPDNLIARWNTWASQPGGELLFMGLPADPAAVREGYIPPDVLNSEVLPVIKASKKYGGVMLWNRFYDQTYSSAILPNI